VILMARRSIATRADVGSIPTAASLVSGCSSVWLERLLWEQEAASSNLVTLTLASVKLTNPARSLVDS
jgi:hypothetical protein